MNALITLLLAGMFPLLAAAEDFICPASITVAGGITNKPPGWRSYIRGSEALARNDGRYSLSRVEFSEYDDIDFLSPSNMIDKENTIRYRWKLAGNNEYDIDCLYQPILTHLTRRLPSGLKICEVTYQKEKNGQLSFSAARCY